MSEQKKGMAVPSRLAAALAGIQPQAPPPVNALDFLPRYAGLTNAPNQPAGPPQTYQPPMGAPNPQAAPGYGPAWSTPSPQMGMPQQAAWLPLADQQRTAAFDPTRDFADPNNQHMVDEYGRLIARNGLLGPT